ncbi:MAG: recombinase family protein [Deltaproteobacteria bacterium]|nr:recombinase family protein [Deltaproteobacteria bacterium]
MLFGYARVSTDDQSLDLQKDCLIKSGVALEQIYEEHVSGVKTNRPQLTECLRSLREGDVLVVWRLDRLGRSVPELIKIMVDLQKRGVEFRSLTESIDTSTATGKMVFHMLAAFAEFERNLISERTKAGLKAARARGHRGGRKPKLNAKHLKAAKAMLGDPTTTMQEVADTLGVSRATVYRALEREKEPTTMKQLKKQAKAAGKAERHIQ